VGHCLPRATSYLWWCSLPMTLVFYRARALNHRKNMRYVPDSLAIIFEEQCCVYGLQGLPMGVGGCPNTCFLNGAPKGRGYLHRLDRGVIVAR
jgi:hypothetical protein